MKLTHANVTVIKVERALIEQGKELAFRQTFRTRHEPKISFDDYNTFNEDGGVNDSDSENR